MAPLMHMFWMVMLRCDSSAGFGDPVEPVVKITSAPSSGVIAAVAFSIAADAVLSVFSAARRAGSVISDKARVPGIASVETANRCSMPLQFSSTAFHVARKSKRRGHSKADESARPQFIEHANNFAGRKPQIERRHDHANLEAGVLQQHVIDRQRQLCHQEIALAEAELQQFSRQRGCVPVEFASGKCAASIGTQHGSGVGLGKRPFGYHSVQQVAVGIFVFVIGECVARHLHGVEKRSCRGIAFSWSPEARCCRL